MVLDGKYYGTKKSEYDDTLKDCIEETCQYCLENTFADSEEKINRPIMMLGKIQSGKTRAFTGLIALAFDNNFDMVFILTKNSKALVQQTVSRMKKEFAFENRSIIVTDIMKASSKMSGYELERKNIIVAKKESRNIANLIDFIEKHSINEHKRCLIIDDEADTTGIGYKKIKGTDEFTLRTVSSKVNEMRGTLDGCVFVEVTATPYSLYLQPNFDENAPIKPIKPLKTVLVPHGSEYIGGEYYFLDSKEETHPASLIFEPMSQEECDLVADQKRKGKKSKIDDRRSFKVEEILFREDRLSTFKMGIINFIVGTITLRKVYKNDDCYAYVIHTAMQKNSHVSLESAAETLFEQIKHRTVEATLKIEQLLQVAYEDIKKSVEIHGLTMPSYKEICAEFYCYIDKGYYSIDIVNADQDIETLLDEDSGELLLRTPCSIFVGGQVLDRGVTIHNMIGFYYGRNPITMQQDTVLQHSRMFGYRKKLLPVTRFYTTSRIHSNMEKITEIDMVLRDDIASGNQGNGVYFITNQLQDKQYGTGGIKPCSPDKIKVSDIILLKPHCRVLPVGFSPVAKSKYNEVNKRIEQELNDNSNFFTSKMNLESVSELMENVYKTIEKDEDSSRFISKEEFLTSLKYMLDGQKEVAIVVKRDKANKKVRTNGRIEDSPAQGQQELLTAQKLATTLPVIILLQQNGQDDTWGFRPFWWPVLVSPKTVQNTMYASKIAGEKLISQ